MMNSEVKDKWIAALASGEYDKTTHALRTHAGYCCLGVLCDLYQKDTGHGAWDRVSMSGTLTFTDALGEQQQAFPPSAVLAWAGLGDNTHVKFETPVQLREDYEVNQLTQLNDANDTFASVIEVIREQF